MSPSSRPLTIVISTGTVIKVIVALVAVGVLWEIRDILLALFTAVILAGVMYPFVRFAQRYHIPSSVAVIVFYLLLFGAVAAVFALLIPAIVQEVGQIGASYDVRSAWIYDQIDRIKTFTASFGVAPDISSGLAGLQEYGQRVLSQVVGAISDFFGGVAGFVLVLVLSYYLIAEERALKEGARGIIPERYRDVSAKIVWQVLDKLGGWLRGQVALGIIIGLLYYLGLSLLGVPYALALALIAGLLEFIPYLGPLLAAIPALVLALSVSPMTALFALVYLVIIQQMENHLLVPKVMQRAIGLNPVVSIMAFLVGARLFGIPGAIFAIPIAMAATVVWNEVASFRREGR